MTGKKTMVTDPRWNTTDSGIDEPKPLSKEIMQRHAELIREYTTILQRIGGARKASRIVREAEEVARANLVAFERIHGLTSPDPRIG